MKPTLSQLEAWKAIRKLLPPQGRVERPMKGGGYKRRPKHRKLYETSEAV